MSLPLLTQPPSIGCGDPGEPIGFSCRFDGGQYFSKTPAIAGNRSTFTLDGWFKYSTENDRYFLVSGITTSYYTYISGALYTHTTPNRVLNQATGGSEAKFRDYASFCHVHWIFDSTNPDPAMRNQPWINGKLTNINWDNAPVLNEIYQINRVTPHFFGSAHNGAAPSKMYASEFHFLDGLTPPPTDFGYFNSDGQWMPKKYEGAHGQNGYHFDFADPLDLGKDVSGNGNHWASPGLTPDNQSTDTPTNNLPTINVAGSTHGATISEGALKAQTATSYDGMTDTTIALNSGKWYWEMEAITGGGSPQSYQFGIKATDEYSTSSWSDIGGEIGISYSGSGGTKKRNNVSEAYGPNFSGGARIGVALDLDAGTIKYIDENGVDLGIAYNDLDLSKHYTPAYSDSSGTNNSSARYVFAEGDFTHAIPNGFNPISVPNLPCPEILNPDEHFTIRLKSNGDDVTDLLWNPTSNKTLVLSKRLDASGDWRVVDTLRGASKWWSFGGTAIEQTDADGLTAFTANGYTIGADADYQGNRGDYIWKAGRKSGFDIIQVAHVSGTPTIVSHNCGGVIEYGWVFNATAGGDRRIYHKDFPAGQYLRLNSTAVAATDNGWFASTANDLTLGASLATGTYYLYVWRSVPGFSSFTKFKGNGSSDGAFSETDFHPRLASIFRYGAASNHHLSDFDREGINPVKKYNNMEATSGEGSTTRDIDFVSNGLKIRASTSDINGNGSDLVSAAWAKTPFKFARAQ